MSAEIDVPFVNPDAFTGGGNFLTPDDVFSPTPTTLESILTQTGASEEQASAVQSSINNFGKSVESFFSNLIGPDTIKADPNTGSDASPATKETPPSNGISKQINQGYNSLLKNVVKGAVVVGGSAAGIGAATNFLGSSASNAVDKVNTALGNIDETIGLPSGTSWIVVGAIVILLLVVLVKH